MPASRLPRILASLLLSLQAAALAQHAPGVQAKSAHPAADPGALPFQYAASGDLAYKAVFAPSAPAWRGWTWGPGAAGQDRYAAGAAVALVREPGAWTYGALVTPSWSFGGADDHPDARGFQLQPIASYRLSPRHTIGYAGAISADWDRRGGQRWTVPLGMTWSTLSRPDGAVPVNTIIGAGFNVVRPDRAGTWFVRFQLNVTLPGR